MRSTVLKNSTLVLLILGAMGIGCLVGPEIAEKISYALAAGENRAAREQIAELNRADRTSELYRAVAKAVRPAVVVVHVRKKMDMRGHPSASEMDEFMRRYFGRSPHRVPLPRTAPDDKNKDAPKREYYSSGVGSGVIVDAKKGYVLTNWHVVQGADEVEIALLDGRRVKTEWVRTDQKTDVAVVKIKPDRLIDAPLGDSDRIEVGDCVLAVGAPEGLPQTVTAGIISAKGRTTGRRGYENFLQTDAAINHGNSGGPLVDMKGEIIGINTAIVSRTGVNEGIGLAIPSNMVRNVMRQLIDSGEVVRGYIGVHIQDVDEKLAKSFKLPNADGVLVAGVAPRGPARKAGMETGDFIVNVGQKRTKNVNELRNYIASLRPGESVKVKLYREGKVKAVTLKIAKQPEDMLAAFSAPQLKPKAISRLGLEVTTATPEIAQKHGFSKGVKGVIITNVVKGSDAEKNSLTEGLLITKVQGKAIASADDFNKAIGSAKAAGTRLLVKDKSGGQRFVFIEFTKSK
ncbi:MAG: Do family serine endopeptidase [Phycisphaerae bacterium]|jgi:serine protease Do|nr:Do family serine endopeptidase [Phycisphaerae bacterium]